MTNDTRIKQKVVEILSGAKRIVYPPADERSNNTPDGNTLFLLTKDERDALIILEKEAEIILATSEKKSALWGFVRFINPHVPARLFSVKVESKHTQIDDQEKVFKEIDTRLYFERKRILAAMHKALDGIEDNDKLRAEIQAQAHQKIRTAQAHNILLKKYKNALKMRVSGLKKKRFYNELTYYLYPVSDLPEAQKESLKRRSGHLSIDTPTAIWYEPQEKRIHESDQKFIEEAIDAQYGDIYYMPSPSATISKEALQAELDALLKLSSEELEEMQDAYRKKDI
jgi:hypothetical protein